MHFDFSETFRIIEVVHVEFRQFRIARNAHSDNEIIHARKIRSHGKFYRKRTYDSPRSATKRSIEYAFRIRIDDLTGRVTLGFSAHVYFIAYEIGIKFVVERRKFARFRGYSVSDYSRLGVEIKYVVAFRRNRNDALGAAKGVLRSFDKSSFAAFGYDISFRVFYGVPRRFAVIRRKIFDERKFFRYRDSVEI